MDTRSTKTIDLHTYYYKKTEIDELFVKKANIVTNYTTNDDTKVLSASQGVALKGLIDGKSDIGHTHNYATPQEVALKENISNKTSTWHDEADNNRYPSELLVKNSLATKENTSNRVNNISSSSDNTHYPTALAVYNYAQPQGDYLVASDIADKVDKVSGKQLSTEDFTTAYKNKLDSIEGGASVITVDNALSSTSENPVQNKVINSALNNKVDKVSGKGLSTNDYTTTEKNKLNNIAEEANKTIVDSALSSTSSNPVQNSVINLALNNKVDKVSGKGLSTNDYTTTEKNKLAGLSNTTVDSSLNNSSTNPVQNKVIYSALNNKVDAVSGKGLSTNDYTTTEKNKLAGLNNTTVDTALNSTSTNPVQNKAIYSELDNKVDKVSGKGLSTNDYTTNEKNKLAGLNNITIDTELNNSSTNPVQNKIINSALSNKISKQTNNTNILLANGETKAQADFATAHTHNYLPNNSDATTSYNIKAKGFKVVDHDTNNIGFIKSNGTVDTSPYNNYSHPSAQQCSHTHAYSSLTGLPGIGTWDLVSGPYSIIKLYVNTALKIAYLYIHITDKYMQGNTDIPLFDATSPDYSFLANYKPLETYYFTCHNYHLKGYVSSIDGTVYIILKDILDSQYEHVPIDLSCFYPYK